jgi:hypothetical protein
MSETNLLGSLYCYLLSRNVNRRPECAVKIPDLYRLVDDKLRFCEIVLGNSVIVTLSTYLE